VFTRGRIRENRFPRVWHYNCFW